MKSHRTSVLVLAIILPSGCDSGSSTTYNTTVNRSPAILKETQHEHQHVHTTGIAHEHEHTGDEEIAHEHEHKHE